MIRWREEARDIIKGIYRTQAAFARAVGCDPSTVSAKLNNKRREFQSDVLDRWCTALNALSDVDVQPGELIEWVPDPPGYVRRRRPQRAK